MEFKVGDKVKVIDISECNNYYILGNIYTITIVDLGSHGLVQYSLDDISDMFAWEEEIELVHVDTKLNRLLYPEYIPVNGYLEKKGV